MTQKKMTSSEQAGKTDSGGRLGQKRGSTLPSRLVAELWGSSSSYSRPATDSEIVQALLPAHPRAFWQVVKRSIITGKEESWPLIKAAVKDERLLRLCIGRLARESGGTRGSMSHYDKRTVFAHAGSLFAGACRFQEKSDAWLANRLAPLMRAFIGQPAAESFDAIGAAAASGRLAAARELLPTFPDQRENSADQRLRYGRTGYSSGGLAEVGARSQARGHLREMAASGSARAWMEPGRDLRNAFFWLAAQAQAWRESSPSQSAEWAAIAVELAARGAPCPMEAAYACPELLGELARQRSELAAGERHQTPSFYLSSRVDILFEALDGADQATAAAICAHDASFQEVGKSIVMGCKEEGVIPAAAIALLLGCDPEAGLRPAGPSRPFKIAGALVEAAKDGSLSQETIQSARFARRHRSMTFEGLERELGVARAARASAKKVADSAPAQKARRPKP